MATALFSTAALLPSQNGEARSGLALNLSRSFSCKRMMYSQNFMRRKICSTHRSRDVIASVIGRKVQKRETVIPDPDYRIPIVLLGAAGGLAYTNNLVPAAPVGLLGLLLLFQVVITEDGWREARQL